ncbi:unnamed protein product [Peronospora belbahrii]|uniref:Uncharacterized protein n=1 Tax=Peronospora belbahrii TaxID=622444 RepID=A0ABN8D8X3_9STRA|nr:unnamed protein product [Peronospora belbahrii]
MITNEACRKAFFSDGFEMLDLNYVSIDASDVCVRGVKGEYLCADDMGTSLIKTKSNNGSDDHKYMDDVKDIDDDNDSYDYKDSYNDAKNSGDAENKYDGKDSGDVLMGWVSGNLNGDCRDRVCPPFTRVCRPR